MNTTPLVDRQINTRVTGIDAYRIFACLMVIINHCNSKVMYQLTPMSLAWFVTVGMFYITKVAVPGFFMIAGYNLLHKEDSWGKSWVRVRRILIAILIFSALYFGWKVYIGGIVVSAATWYAYIWKFLVTMVSTIITSPITDAYWYLYTYLGLMIILPFLQRLVSKMKETDYKYFFILGFVFVCVLPTIGELVPGLRISSYFDLQLLVCSIFYMMIGHYYYITNGFMDEFTGGKTIKSWTLFVGMITGFVMNILISVWEYFYTAGDSFLSIGQIEYLPLFLESVCLFQLLMRAYYPSWLEKTISFIAPLTFGIYLLTDFLCAETNLMYYYLCPHMNRLFAVAIEDVVVFLIGIAVVYLLRLIPPVKKIL